MLETEMPSPGLSLVGYMDQAQALKHLRRGCIPEDASDVALLAEWSAAKNRIKPFGTNAGNPEMLPIVGEDATYVQKLLGQQWVKQAFTHYGYNSFEVKLVQIEPLLAFQIHLETARSNHHCAALSNPTISDLLPIFLPMSQPKFNDFQPVIDVQANSLLIKTRSLDVRCVGPAVNEMNVNDYTSIVAAIHLNIQLPFVQVVRFNGRCYLHNGFHRCYGAAKAGATHAPCLVRDVNTPEAVGICPEIYGKAWRTFPLGLLESPNPPTMGHFIRGCAHPVSLRQFSRVIHLSWAETRVPDEYEQLTP